MRLQKHLNEANDVPQKAWDLIKKKCQPFLKEWIPVNKRLGDFYPLWRGMTRTGKEYGEKDVRGDRKPSDSSKEFHTEVNNIMRQVHKVAGRTSSVFVTGDPDQTFVYGEQHMIFPAGRYTYLYNPSIRDLFIDVSKRGYYRDINQGAHALYRKRNDLRDDVISGKIDREEVIRELEKMVINQNRDILWRLIKEYKTSDLKKAISSHTEIMIQCESYIYVRSQWYDELQDLIESEL